MKTRIQILLALTLLLGLHRAGAQGTAFTYQGRLNNNGGPANGNYDLTFGLFSVSNGVGQVGITLTKLQTGMTNGLFTTTLDFGPGIFTGANLWLEIAVRTNGGGGFTTLSPRQPLTPAPYAILANTANNLAGTLPSGQLTGTYSGPVNFNNGADSFDGTFYGQFYGSTFTGGTFTGAFLGNGSGLAGVNAGTLGGLGATNFWQTGGNLGTSAGVNFLGTTDNQPLEFKVNGARALRLEPTTDSPNVVGGLAGNYVMPGVYGATIGGGGAMNYYGSASSNTVKANLASIAGGSGNMIGTNADASMIGGGFSNHITFELTNFTGGQGVVIAGGYYNYANGNGGTIGGGYYNNNQATIGTIGGGYRNSTLGYDATIAGGLGNVASGNGSFIGGGGGDGAFINVGHLASGSLSTIAGGLKHRATGNYSAIGGGSSNVTSNPYSTIPGGLLNTAAGAYATLGGGHENLNSSDYSTIAGGLNNTNQSNTSFSAIGGGWLNLIQDGADQSVVAGGNAGQIQSGARESFIGGGFANRIQTNAGVSFIGGGSGNSVGISSSFSTIAGGLGNSVGANASVATVGGGYGNTSSSSYATVAGGLLNSATNSYATVPGGAGNTAGGQFSFAAGHDAKALHDGTFVWSDSPGGGFASTTNDQFLIRATNGVGINKNNPATALDVNGAVTATSFNGNGSGVTSLNAASLTGFVPSASLSSVPAGNLTGTIADARLSANVALLNANQTFAGANAMTNAANSFTGNGAGLTSLNAANLTGSVPSAALTSVPASSLTGTIADARLSANVALLNANQVFTGSNTFAMTLTSASLIVNNTARIQGGNNWNVTGSEGDFRVGNDTYRFKIGVANNGGGAGDVWMRAHGGTQRVFIKTPGGTSIFSNEGETAGVSLAANGTAWAVISDRNVKKDIASVDHRMILEKLAALPITQWHYQWESPDVTPHIGPMAQDFKAAFYPGTDDKSITTQEADGVALSAIQGLNRKLEEQLRAKDARLEALERRLERLERLK